MLDAFSALFQVIRQQFVYQALFADRRSSLRIPIAVQSSSIDFLQVP